ncbi:S-adenosyl-L-methionine-dependent methyltransferase [Crucibulum laeve]|uniref:DNA (cytosine-5-)-methyltransferase n=1 Tax=Crucibulum laeve TaxID=68775 RepID=A0A5C3MC98_9AGAR|nr:S-adenosyl-L-methionine-dependent methyltransferase [Crucibulum laeve]
MPPRNRPTAFEVSYPEEAAAIRAQEELAAARASSSRSTPQTASEIYKASLRAGSGSQALKRKTEDLGDSRPVKRQQLPDVAYYKPRPGAIRETKDVVIPGEDPDEDGEDKPVRMLTDFSIFDPKHRNEMLSLAAMEEEDAIDRQFEGAGLVVPFFLSEEDEGQEEELQEVYVHLGAILRSTVDYTKPNDPFYIETECAWYTLRRPSRAYEPFYQHFHTPRRIAQIVISTALERPQQIYDDFLRIFTSKVDIFGRTYLEEHLYEAVIELQEALEDCDDRGRIRNSPVIRRLLRRAPAPSQRNHTPRVDGPRNRQAPKNRAMIGNPDLAVLKPENQNTTRVSPRIAALSEGLIREVLDVVGPPPVREDKAIVQAREKRAFLRLWEYIKIAKKVKNWNSFREDRISPGSEYYTKATVDGKTYEIGDFIIMPQGTDGRNKPTPLPDKYDDIPELATVDEYFWFAKILYIKGDRAHVQWLEHGQQTMLEELGHRQELFLNELCGFVPLSTIVAKVKVHEIPPPGFVAPPDDYFYKFTHRKWDSSYSTIDMAQMESCSNLPPPDNCPVCLAKTERDQDEVNVELKDEDGNLNGVAYAGKKYHCHDFVLYRAESGPANIGYVTSVNRARRHNEQMTLTLKRVGRISSIPDNVLPQEKMKDERQLYITSEEIVVDVQELVQVIFVPHISAFEEPKAPLDQWLEISPDHFYLRYKFPALKVTSWDDRIRLRGDKQVVCTPCLQERLQERLDLLEFLDEREPLPMLDLFAGAGAFSRGLAEGSGGCFKVTHAVEISPSAAKTFKRNSPDTVVYNQCANLFLRHLMKTWAGHNPEPPKQLFDGKTYIPEPPMPGMIKAIASGFPCQTHSTLNMFKVADDVKSNLLLTTMAALDQTQADIAFCENVPGFLSYNLNSVQASQYKVEGGIEMGGLKLLVRAALDMDYQVVFGNLQAGQYGTPQRRIRFFVILAKRHIPLPKLPQPTHDFPGATSLQIKFPNGNIIRPIRTTEGTALHPAVTIDDAISDLARFDWRLPGPEMPKDKRDREQRRVAVVNCVPDAKHWGFEGRIGYRHEPKTTYQASARLRPPTNIQHFTKVLQPNKVKRVIAIPLSANADYRSGLYGRLDKDGCFPTTVTNMDPTAKQSKVLNPYCRRMVTVRELARSQGFPDDFVFEAYGDNVVTMHRQIGNALPLPLAYAIGREVRNALFKRWREERQRHKRQNDMEVDSPKSPEDENLDDDLY